MKVYVQIDHCWLNEVFYFFNWNSFKRTLKFGVICKKKILYLIQGSIVNVKVLKICIKYLNMYSDSFIISSEIKVFPFEMGGN